MTHSTYRDIRMTDAYSFYRDTLSYVATDRLSLFAGMADTDAKRKAVSDETVARTSPHYADYRANLADYTPAEMITLRDSGGFPSDVMNLALADELRSRD